MLCGNNKLPVTKSVKNSLGNMETLDNGIFMITNLKV